MRNAFLSILLSLSFVVSVAQPASAGCFDDYWHSEWMKEHVTQRSLAKAGIVLAFLTPLANQIWAMDWSYFGISTDHNAILQMSGGSFETLLQILMAFGALISYKVYFDPPNPVTQSEV